VNCFLEHSILTHRFVKNSVAENADIAVELLEELLRVYRYPILNRLESLNIFLMHQVNKYHAIWQSRDICGRRDKIQQDIIKLENKYHHLQELIEKAPIKRPDTPLPLTLKKHKAFAAKKREMIH
jgi:hypothetical protein